MKRITIRRGTGLLLMLLLAQSVAAVSEIGRILEESAKNGQFSGAVLASKNGRIVYRGAVGVADRGWSIANTPETKFRISSITKQFTALLVMQLVEEGKIDLDEPVSKYLKGLKSDSFTKVSVRSLLQSASGLPGLDSEEFYTSLDKRLTDPNYVIAKYLSGNLISEPGTKFNYNNGDFIVAGAIVSEMTGLTFEEAVQTRILDRLQMRGTGFTKNGGIVEGLARGYTFENGVYLNEPFQNIENYGAAGAMYSTVDDMFKWNKALIANTLLGKKSTDEMFAPSEKLGFVALGSWSYALKTGSEVSLHMVERQGGIGGFSALNLLAPKEELSVVILGNLSTNVLFETYAGKGLSFEILRLTSQAQATK